VLERNRIQANPQRGQPIVSEVTTSGPIVIIGAGGFGREVLDVIEAINAVGGSLEFQGFLDDGPVDETLVAARGVPLIGRVAGGVPPGVRYVIGIANASTRRRIDAQLTADGLQPGVLVHPAATLGSDVRLGFGSVVTAGVRVTTNIEIGHHVHLNLNCTVGHDSIVGDYVSVFPGATVSGNVTIGDGATVGTGANVLPGVTIGEGAFVGAGAVVTRDVEPRATVVGSPAKPIKGPQEGDK
jgi:sugar O-acyltransferase (sialic acid O-acetyltransferase NeuD family)